MPIISGGGGGGLGSVVLSGTPSAGQVPIASGSAAAAWATPPGTEIGYDPITASVNVTATTEGTANTILACAAHTFDGAPVLATFNCSGIETGSAASTQVKVLLQEGATIISYMVFLQAPNVGTSRIIAPAMWALRFSPTAGPHTYTVTAYASVTTGTPSVDAGTGLAGTNLGPAFMRFTKV